MCEGEEGFTGAAAGKDLMFRVDGSSGKLEATTEPLGDHSAKFKETLGRRVLGQAIEMMGQSLFNQVGCWMLWFTHRQGDVIKVRRWRQSRLQSGQPLKRIGLETVQKGVHRLKGGEG